jgi:hypothetical protein
MGRINKVFSFLLVVILAASSLIMVESASAQSIPKPSVPEFTVRIVESSLEVTIKNQPITAYVDTDSDNPSLYYGFRFKDHNATIPDWYDVPMWYFFGYSSYETYYKASDSDNTVVSFPFENLTYTLNSGRVDMQVMALIGNEIPSNAQNRIIYVFDGVMGSWSDVQTVTIPTSSSSPSATPTTSIQGWVTQLTFSIIAVVILAIVIISILIYRRHRKTA